MQAFSIAAAIEEALDDDLRARMSRMFLHLVSFAIERNLPLTVLQRWLAQPTTFTRDARVSQDSGIRQYAAGAFIREARGSVDALLARLDTFLFLRETRRALSAAHCVAFEECLDHGLTIIDLGDPPAGAERATRFWAGVLVGRLTRAILSRRLRHNSPHAWVILEEFQEAITGRQGQQFARLLALARHKRVALTFVNQQVAQLDTALVRILRTNTGYEAIFRSSFEDAKLIGHALPASRDDKRSQRQQLIEAIPRLPNRTFYFWEKTMSAQRVRSPRVDLDALRSAARDAPPELRRFIRQGTVAVPSRDIDLGPVECELPAAPVTREAAFLTPNRTDDESAWPGLG
ncbi:MAG: hypothetical protein IPK72_15745 [Candidatus Eisenbacteria bacterium]|nr:hypothetical protein [Candidatus Eisenbacteria bacterium]